MRAKPPAFRTSAADGEPTGESRGNTMANSSQTLKMRSTHGNRKLFAALRDGTDGYGNIGINDGSRIWAPQYWWVYRCTVVSGAIGATALAASTSQALDLHTAFPNHLFPEGVIIHACVLKLITAFSGGAISAATASVGDAGNDDEWVDLQDIFTGAAVVPETDQADADATEAAGGFSKYEDAFIPLLSLTSTSANLSA